MFLDIVDENYFCCSDCVRCHIYFIQKDTYGTIPYYLYFINMFVLIDDKNTYKSISIQLLIRDLTNIEIAWIPSPWNFACDT